MDTTRETIAERRQRAIAAGPTLWSAGVSRRAAWLAHGFAALASAQGALFAEALDHIPASAGLSRAMVAWALESSLGPLTAEALLAFDQTLPRPSLRAVRARPGELCVVVLAGNVFSAAARAVALPLLFGMPVLAKTAADDAAFLRLLSRALHAADPQLAEALQVVTFSSGEANLTQTLFERADTLIAYGSDRTLHEVRAQLDAKVSFVGHGHGLGAAFVDRAALSHEELARSAAAALAFDVAAYDQRGCMSPLVAWVRRGQPIAPAQFAHLVHEALGALAVSLPRGLLPLDVASAQLSFRGIAAMRGLLLEGDGYAVAYEGAGALRVGPGYRNLLLLDIDDAAALPTALAPLGVHLKCLGVAGLSGSAELDALIAGLPARMAPRVCPLGRMQEPKLDALHDGVAAWEGLLRYTERDA